MFWATKLYNPHLCLHKFKIISPYRWAFPAGKWLVFVKHSNVIPMTARDESNQWAIGHLLKVETILVNKVFYPC